MNSAIIRSLLALWLVNHIQSLCYHFPHTHTNLLHWLLLSFSPDGRFLLPSHSVRNQSRRRAPRKAYGMLCNRHWAPTLSVSPVTPSQPPPPQLFLGCCIIKHHHLHRATAMTRSVPQTELSLESRHLPKWLLDVHFTLTKTKQRRRKSWLGTKSSTTSKLQSLHLDNSGAANIGIEMIQKPPHKNWPMSACLRCVMKRTVWKCTPST